MSKVLLKLRQKTDRYTLELDSSAPARQRAALLLVRPADYYLCQIFPGYLPGSVVSACESSSIRTKLSRPYDHVETAIEVLVPLESLSLQ